MNKHYIGYGLVIFALLALVYLWHKNEIQVARAEERSVAHEQLIAQLKEQEKSIEADRAKVISNLEAERAKPATVQTVTRWLPSPLPNGSEVKIQQLPDAPTPQLVLTGDAQTNLKAIQDMEIAHRECDTNLKACTDTAALRNQRLAEMTKDRDNWKQTAKGGSKWHRFMKAAKIVGCAGGGAAIGSLVGKTRGAAIGAAAGAGTCEVIW